MESSFSDWKTPSIAAIVSLVVVFFAAITIQGVPFSWVFRSLAPLDITAGALTVEVSPQIPTTLGQEIMVTVRDASTNKPVEKATVSISRDGGKLLDLMTNDKGQTRFEYPGMTTIIVVRKDRYAAAMKVIPRVPDAWILAEERSWIASIVTGVLVFIITKRMQK